VNIQLICKHFNEFIVFLSNSKIIFDIIYLVEICLENNSLNFEIEVYNYYRKLNKSDEISLYIRNVLRVNPVSLGVIDLCSSISFNILN